MGARSVIDKLIMSNIDKLSFNPESDDVLDVGCGTGYRTVLIGSRVRSIVGIETNVQKLAVAERDYAAHNVTYVKVDSLQNVGECALKWRSNFDKVVCLSSLYYVPDVEAVLQNMYDCLKPGGESLIILPYDHQNLFKEAVNFMQSHEEWKTLIEEHDSPLCLWERNEKDTHEFFSSSGWSEVSCNIQQVNVIFNEQKAKLILWDMLDHIDKVDADKKSRCLEDLWQWCLREYQHTEDGSMSKNAHWMIIVARK